MNAGGVKSLFVGVDDKQGTEVLYFPHRVQPSHASRSGKLP